jgi:hypothetical protein
MSLFFLAFGLFWSEIEDIYSSGDIQDPHVSSLFMSYPGASPLGDRFCRPSYKRLVARADCGLPAPSHFLPSPWILRLLSPAGTAPSLTYPCILVVGNRCHGASFIQARLRYPLGLRSGSLI